jgi:hypothetical protein
MFNCSVLIVSSHTTTRPNTKVEVVGGLRTADTGFQLGAKLRLGLRDELLARMLLVNWQFVRLFPFNVLLAGVGMPDEFKVIVLKNL